MYDPNEYIRGLSHIKKYISSKLPYNVKNDTFI